MDSVGTLPPDALSRAVAAFGTGSDEAKKFTAFAVSLGVTATE